MADVSRKRVQRATAVFWVLLIYIIAALWWWAFSLERQNNEMYALQKTALAQRLTDTASDTYQKALQKIEEQKRRNTVKYISEGAIFLLLILIGAVFIYRSVRRQFRLQQQQQNFVMAVTHELKTPISVARLNLETLQRHRLDAEKQAKLLQGSLQETMRLDALINNILLSSQLDGNAYKATKEELNFSDLVKDVCQQFAHRYPDRKFSTAVDENIELNGDALLLKLLLSNLLENANKYSDKNSAVTCRLHVRVSRAMLQVADEGAGIPAEEKSKIFDRFYRMGDEQTRKTKGTGLGLYICKKIAEHHNAQLSVTDNEAAGSTFTVQFPAT